MPSRRKSHQPSAQFVKELAEELGRVIIAASQIEFALNIALQRLLRLNRLQERALILPMSISTKITTLRQFGKEYLPATKHKTLKNILTEIRKCADTRNDLAHGLHGSKSGKFFVVAFSGDARIAGRPVAWTTGTLKNLRDRMIAARNVAANIAILFPKHLKLPKNRLPTLPFVR